MKRICVFMIIGGILLSSGLSEGWDQEVHKRVTANTINQLRAGGYWSYARYIYENSYCRKIVDNYPYPTVLDPEIMGPDLPVANERLPEYPLDKRWTLGTEDWDRGLVENFVLCSNWADVFYCHDRDKNDCRRWKDMLIPQPYPHHGLFGKWLVEPTEDFFDWAIEEWTDEGFEAANRVQALKWIGRACHFMGDATYPGHVPSLYLWRIHRHLSPMAEDIPFTDRTYYPHESCYIGTNLNIRGYILQCFETAKAMVSYCDGRNPNALNLWAANEDDVEMVLETTLRLSQEGNTSLIATFLKTVGFLGRPLELQATRVAEDTVYLSWKDNSLGEDKFPMYRTENPQDWDDDPHIDTISGLAGEGSVKSWSEIDVIRGQSYWYRVTATGDIAWEWSQYADNVRCNVPYLNAPTQFAVAPKSYNQAEFRWHDNSRYDDCFKVEPGGIIVQGNGEPRGNVSNIKDCQKLDTERTFTVTAVDGNGNMSLPSEDITICCGGVAQERVVAKPLDNAAHIMWEKPRLPFGTKTLVVRKQTTALIAWIPTKGEVYPEDHSVPGHTDIMVVYNGDYNQFKDEDVANSITYRYRFFSYDANLIYVNTSVEKMTHKDVTPTSLSAYMTNVENGMGPNSSANVAVTPDNVICMVWATETDPGVTGEEILYVESVDGGVSWSDPICINGPIERNLCPAIASGPDGTRCVVWSGGVMGRTLYFNYKTTSSDWLDSPLPLQEGEASCYDDKPGIAVDDAGEIHVVYQYIDMPPGSEKYYCGVNYIKFNTSSSFPPSSDCLESQLHDAPGPGQEIMAGYYSCVVTVNSSGRPLVLLYGWDNYGTWPLSWVNYYFHNGSDWVSGSAPGQRSHALCHDGNEFYAVWAHENIYCASFDGNAWTSPPDVVVEGIEQPASPVVSTLNGDIYVAWQDKTPEGEYIIGCIRKHSGNWEDAFLLTKTPVTKQMPEIAFFSEGINDYLCAIWGFGDQAPYSLVFWRDLAPDITVSLPTAYNDQYAKWRSGWSLPFRYEMSDNIEISLRQFQLATANGDEIREIHPLPRPDGTYWWDIEDNLDGDYTIKVEAWDNLGNVGEGLSEIFAVSDMRVFNPGFEDDQYWPNGVPACWIEYGTGAKGQTSAQSHGGGHSLHLHRATTDGYFGIYQQKIPCEPNTTYWLSGWMKTEGVTDGQACMGLGVWEPYSNHADFGHLSGTTEWTYVYGAWTSGPDETEMRITLYGTPDFTGDAYFDDLELTVDNEEPSGGSFSVGGPLEPGCNATITFSASDNVAVEEVRFFYASNACGPWSGAGSVHPREKTIASNLMWTVPSTVRTGKECHIRMTVSDPQGNTYSQEQNTGQEFVDGIDPEISILFPTAATNVGIGDACPLAWNATDNGQIEFDSFLVTHNSGDADPLWRFIGAAPGHDTTFDWVVGGPPSNECRIKAISYDMAGNKTEAIGENFSICGLASNNKGCTAGPTKLQVDSQGKLHLVFAKDGFVYYATRSPGDEIWSRSILGTGTGPSISYNDNWLAMTWVDGNELWYTTVEPNSQEPVPAQQLAVLHYSPLTPSIVLDGSSSPVAHIAWSGQDKRYPSSNASALFYGTLNVGDVSTFSYSFLFEAPDSLAYADPWIDLDESGVPHIVTVFPGDSVYYVVKRSSGWKAHYVGALGSYPSIDIKDQHVYLVWESNGEVWEIHFVVGLKPSHGQIVNISKSSKSSTSPVIVSGHALWSEDVSLGPIPKWQIYHSRFNGIKWTDAEDVDGSTNGANEHFPQGVMESGMIIQEDYIRYAALRRVCASGTEDRGYEIKYGSESWRISRLLSGHISEDLELQEHTYVTGDVIVDSGITLTLSPGISLFFAANTDDQMAGEDTARCEFVVKGQLKAVGNDSTMVTFTSTDTLPQTGDWCGIRFESPTELVDSLVFCNIEYADIGIEIEDGNLEISNSEIKNNKIGIEASGGSISAKWNKIVDNDSVGVIAHVTEGIDFGADGNHGNNRIHGNEVFDFQNLAADSMYVQWNYWGTWNEDSVMSTIEGPIVIAPIVTPCPPKLVSPLPGENIHGFSVLLDWVDVMGDTVLYTLQWDTDSTFAGEIEVPDIVASEYTFDSDTLEAVTIYWRVKATNAEADSCWSGMSSFDFDLPTTYWVDGVSGNDNNPGTREAPWATIQHAADVMGPWERVFVRAIPGTYDEQVVPATSGQSGNGIYYQSYPGDTNRAVVGDDNSNLFGFKLRKVSHIFVDGFEIRGQSIAAIDISSSEGVASSHNVVRNCNIVTGDVLSCVHIWGNTPCVGNTIENCSVDISATSSYVVNLTNAPGTRILTTDMEGGTYGCRIDHDCDSVQIESSSIRNTASYGIYAYSGNDGLRIADNTFHNAGENAAVYLSQNKGAIVTGNRVDSTQATATIWLDTKCYNSIVSDNVITMNLPNSGFGIRLRYDNDSVLVSGNTITGGKDHGSAGIYLDWKNSNVEITGNSVDSAMTKGLVIGGTGADNDDVWVTGNSISATDIGIHIEKRTQERTRIVNNFLHSSNHCVFNYGGETAYIAHNSIYTETGTGIFVDQNTGSTDDCTLRNNVVYSGSGYCLKLNLFFSPDGWDSDYNDLYTETGNVGRWGNTDTPTLSDWQSESDGDQHSISADPLFVSVSETNLHITEQSPCRNIATPISWITSDIDGELRDSLRDLGADEWYEQTGGGTMAGTIANIPVIFRLKQNRPNPFRQLTTIDYSIPRAAKVTLRVYDVTGRMVKELVNREQKAGMHTVTWKGKTPRSKTLATGVYFVRLTADSKTATRKLVLVR